MHFNNNRRAELKVGKWCFSKGDLSRKHKGKWPLIFTFEMEVKTTVRNHHELT